MTHQVILDGAGQELRHTLPAAVTSASYEIVDLTKGQTDLARVLEQGAATIPAWSLTIDAPTGLGTASPRRINVGATAGPAFGDVAFVAASSGRYETATILAIETDDYIDGESELEWMYTPGDTLTPAFITAPVPASLSTDEDRIGVPHGVVWTYTLGTAVRTVVEKIDLVRVGVAAAAAPEAAKLIRRGYPDLAARLPDGLTLANLSELCAERVRAELELRGCEPEQLMLGRPGLWLLHDAIVHEAAVRGWAPAQRGLEAFVDEARDRYGVRLEALVIGQGGTSVQLLDTDTTTTTDPDKTVRSPITLAM